MVTSQTGGNIEKHNNDNKDRLEVATKTLKVFAPNLFDCSKKTGAKPLSSLLVEERGSKLGQISLKSL